MSGPTVELSIEALGGGGDGVARTAEGPLYVAGALPGERIRVELGRRRKAATRGRLLEVLEASGDRVRPPCGHFGDCGGCALQHLESGAYLNWKRQRVVAALRQQGLEGVSVAACLTTPPGSRRRARFAARWDRGDVIIGFNRAKSSTIVDLSACPVLRPQIVSLLEPLRGLLGRLFKGRGQAELQITETDGGIDLWIVTGQALDLAVAEILVEFADSSDLARLSWGAKVPEAVVRRRPATVQRGALAIEPPGDAFLQASRAGDRLISHHVGEALQGIEAGSVAVADLFAGCGAISATLSRRFRVHAVDQAESALAALLDGSRRGAAPHSISTEQRDLFRRPLEPSELRAYGAVVFDPPRAGALNQAKALADSVVPKVSITTSTRVYSPRRSRT